MSQRSLGKWLPKLVSSSEKRGIKPKNGVSNLPLINASCCRADSSRPRCQVYVLAASSDWQSDLLLDETHLLTGAVFSPLCLAIGSCLPRATWRGLGEGARCWGYHSWQGEGKGLRPLRKSRGESGLHLNAGQSVELPCYYGAQWGRVQRCGGLEVAAGRSWRTGLGWRLKKKKRCKKS